MQGDGECRGGRAELWTKKGRYYILKYSDSWCTVLVVVVVGAEKARKNSNPIRGEVSLKLLRFQWIRITCSSLQGQPISTRCVVYIRANVLLQSAQSITADTLDLTCTPGEWNGFIELRIGTTCCGYQMNIWIL